MADLELGLHALLRAGQAAVQQRQFEAASKLFAEALQHPGLKQTQGSSDRRWERAEITAELVAALVEWGKSEGQEALLQDALARLPDDLSSATPAHRAVAGRLNFELGRLLLKSRRMSEGRVHLEAAVGLLDGAEQVVGLARANTVLAVLLCMGGELELALTRFHAARVVFEQSSGLRHGRDHARLVMNIGAALTDLGRYHEALDYMAQALRLSELALPGEGPEARFDRGRVYRNLGPLLTHVGRHDESIKAYLAGLGDYDHVIRRSRRRADLPTLLASRASLHMNLGYGYFRQGQLDAADKCYAKADQAYVKLVKNQPFLNDDRARIWVNQAHLAAHRGRFARASRLYARGLRMFESLIAASRSNLEFDRINASLGLARAMAARGRVKQGRPLFEAAMTALADLTRQGQLQHARAWLEAWQAQWTVLQTLPDGDALTAWAEALVRVLAKPARRGLSSGPEPITHLLSALELVAHGTPSASPASTSTGSRATADSARAGVVGQYLVFLLDWLAELLTESDPNWLRQHASLVEQTVASLRCTAVAHPQASHLLAEWFLHTRGLRAQRAALAQGRDPEFIALRDALRELRQLEDEMLGDGGEPAGKDTDPTSRQARLSLPELVSPGRLASRAHRWLDLSGKVEHLRQTLVSAGRLPQALRLNLSLTVARIAPGTALVMLARVGPAQMLAIVLHGANADGRVAQHRLFDLPPDVAAFSCTTLNQLARQSLAYAARGQASRKAADSRGPGKASPAVVDLVLAEPEADLFAIEQFRRLWDCSLALLLPALADQGFVEANLVPSDDLHLMPWSHFADSGQALGCRLQVYPSSGAWLRSLEDDADVLSSPPSPPRWALAADAALRTDQPLHGVEVERLLSLRLWRADMSAITWTAGGRPQAERVNALLGMGHGGSADGNFAHAGLAIGDAVLLAHDLPGLRTCTRALMSTCMLGQTDEAMGEPLGFLAASFDYQTSFGTGWLTEVPDVAACLFSLAFQFALREAYRLAVRRVLWSEVFRATRQGISSGQWPAGFGAWLRREWSRASSQIRARSDASGSALPGGDFTGLDTPPPLLRRVMPWAIALGR